MKKNQFSSRRTRHIDIKHHIIRDAIDRAAAKNVESTEQHADALIKVLDAKSFEGHT